MNWQHCLYKWESGMSLTSLLKLRVDNPMNERLTELEVRVAFQDKTIQELNEVVTRQQREIDHLAKELEAMKSRLAGMAPSMVISQEDEKPPPHY
jgi:SlyX protein